jgi:hypothetical protein
VPYSIISATPIEFYSLRKNDFYEYLDERQRKQFQKYIKVYPKDSDLRRHYFEQMNWLKYRIDHAKDNLPKTMRFKT